MTFATRFENIFKKLLPSPFAIAVLLTFLAIILAFIFTPNNSQQNHLLQILSFWENGIWNPSLIVFMVQMMLILILGHILALSKPISYVINKLTALPKSAASAVWIVTFSTLCVSFFNWGLGLIFGAIIARKMGESFAKRNKKINYPLLGAAGYSGLMVWHGGISGSAPIKAAENLHLQKIMLGIIPKNEISNLPHQISFTETIFSSMNITASFLLLLILPILLAWIAQKTSVNVPTINPYKNNIITEKTHLKGAEKIDYSTWVCWIFALLILCYACYIPLKKTQGLNFITPNYINFLLLGLGLLFHKNFANFLHALDQAIGGASGILLQFPLYFGIIGIMKDSGLVSLMSQFFITHASATSFPIFTFISAGIVNIFVPSGGGQWSIQGPILIQAAQNLNLSLAKNIMALAYGDQITNMLQPFWALPLLAITQLKAKEIIPYSLLLFTTGSIIFITVLLTF